MSDFGHGIVQFSSKQKRGTHVRVADAVMLKFETLHREDVCRLAPWFFAQNTHIGDYSLGFQFMWSKMLAPDFAIYGDCLILRELYAGKYFFYYPLSLSGEQDSVAGAIAEIERFCRDSDIKLHFTNIPREAVSGLVLRYKSGVSLTDIRRWRDYLYDADSFRLYPGKRYAGQRNHVHKFVKLYPEWSFRRYEPSDAPAVAAFLREYEGVQLEKEDRIADEEIAEVYEILPRLGEFGMMAGILEVGGKIVGFSAGERCGDMIVVHIEKALRGFEGVYPMIAQQFAIAFCGEGVKYLNRMDDAGDIGLRKSKLQYLPAELVDKFNITPARAIDTISYLPEIKTERLLLRPVQDSEAKAYAKLASDVARNVYWGYDWREDCKGEPSQEYFLGIAREDFRHRREMPLGIFLGDELVGETVLHRFGYASEAEIGVRLLEAFEGNGYAREAVMSYAEYAFTKLGIERIEAKCFLENERSARMLLSAGLRPCGKDDTYLYFYKTAAM